MCEILEKYSVKSVKMKNRENERKLVKQRKS